MGKWKHAIIYQPGKSFNYKLVHYECFFHFKQWRYYFASVWIVMEQWMQSLTAFVMDLWLLTDEKRQTCVFKDCVSLQCSFLFKKNKVVITHGSISHIGSYGTWYREIMQHDEIKTVWWAIKQNLVLKKKKQHQQMGLPKWCTSIDLYLSHFDQVTNQALLIFQISCFFISLKYIVFHQYV